MATLPETSDWVPVYQLETTDEVLGGIGGKSNKPLIDLTKRTKYLYDQNIIRASESYNNDAAIAALGISIANSLGIIADRDLKENGVFNQIMGDLSIPNMRCFTIYNNKIYVVQFQAGTANHKILVYDAITFVAITAETLTLASTNSTIPILKIQIKDSKIYVCFFESSVCAVYNLSDTSSILASISAGGYIFSIHVSDLHVYVATQNLANQKRIRKYNVSDRAFVSEFVDSSNEMSGISDIFLYGTNIIALTSHATESSRIWFIDDTLGGTTGGYVSLPSLCRAETASKIIADSSTIYISGQLEKVMPIRNGGADFTKRISQNTLGIGNESCISISILGNLMYIQTGSTNTIKILKRNLPTS